MYVPFARKYRPRKFKEVVGQDVPKKVLLNAVRTGKLSHAYLFAGPRGSGKTTLARILTKAINCLNPQDGEPCGECENCVSIDKGNFPDLIEIDAASNRGIEDIRSIRDAVSYTPIKGKYKVYILDEAHMLTKEAFNALLKTLEEPPPRTIFILCTTEYEKILPTILSRCQRLIFGKLSDGEIIYNLNNICRSENLRCEEKALRAIAMVSDGAMRDAVSLLDQAATYGEGNVTVEVIEEFLGLPSQEKVREFVKLLINSQVDEALNAVNDLVQRGFNLMRFWSMVEDEIRTLILYKSLKDPYKVIQVEDYHREFERVPLNALLYLEKIINNAKEYARTRGLQRAIEISIVKSIIVKDILSITDLIKYVSSKEQEEERETKENEETPTAKAEVAQEHKEDLRSKFFKSAKLKPTALSLLEKAPYRIEGDKLIFVISPDDTNVIEPDKIKAQFPYVNFEIEQKSPQEGESVPDVVNKISNLFDAKIIKHEKRKKG